MKAALRGAIVLLAAACTGIVARETVLMPAMLVMWDSAIAGDVERGLQDALADLRIVPAQADAVRAEAQAMRSALASGERETVRPIAWPLLRQIALEGIAAMVAAGELTEGTAGSFRETIAVFDSNMVRLLSRED